MEIGDLGSMLGSFNIAQDASRESGKASNSVFHEDDADDATIMMKGNIWSTEAGKSDETAAIVSGSSPQGFSDFGGLNTEDIIIALDRREKEKSRTPKDQPVPFMVIEADSLEHFELIDNIFSPSLDETLDRIKSSSRKQQGNSEHQMPRHQAGPFKVIKSTSLEDLKLINYIFYSSLDESEIVAHCNHNYLTRSELCTLRPQTCLDDNVISVMSDALTLAERRKKKGSINWYLPICFAEYAYDTSECISFAKKHMFRENYMSALFSCEKMYVPVFDKERRHFYLFVLHMKKQFVQIWDSLAKSSGSSDKRLPNMLAILDILFEDDIQQNYPDGWSFASFSVDRSPNVPQQTNGYDCGVYVIKFMLAPEEATQPDFVFDSDTERLDVVLRLLDGNVNSCRNELAAKAEAYFLRSSGTDDSLRTYVAKMDEETANKYSMLKGINANVNPALNQM
ncbi:hypothetical protein Peur_026021 [Populus x canadensis]